MTKSGSTLEFLYNADGIRTNKIVNGTNHIYTLNETQIVSEAWGSNLLIFLYDESGSPIGMQYRNNTYAANTFTTFYFEKNLQDDIIAVYNESGTKVLSYNYDAWGNHTTTWHNSAGTNINAVYNPFRYRGYYYDTETQLYYLQSRYYNPAWGRFLNADVYVNANSDLIGFNMYAYCSNNPVTHTDSTGESILVPLLIGAGIGAVSQLVSDVVTSIIDNEFQLSSPSTYIGAAVGGGIGTLIPDPVASGAISSMVSTAVEINLSNINYLITGEGKYYSEEEAFYTIGTNGILGGLVGTLGTTNVASKLAEFGEKNIPRKLITDFVTSLPGSGLSGALNSNFGNEMPTSHRWDRTPVRIH